jgi:hypothetical protein
MGLSRLERPKRHRFSEGDAERYEARTNLVNGLALVAITLRCAWSVAHL